MPVPFVERPGPCVAAGRMATNFQSTVPPWLTVTTTWPGTYDLPVVSCWVYGMPQIVSCAIAVSAALSCEANDRAADEIDTHDLVPSPLLRRQQADRDRPLRPGRVPFRLDEWRHRRVRTELLGAERGTELGILCEQPHRLVELLSRRRRLLAALDDLGTSATVD